MCNISSPSNMVEIQMKMTSGGSPDDTTRFIHQRKEKNYLIDLGTEDDQLLLLFISARTVTEENWIKIF